MCQRWSTVVPTSGSGARSMSSRSLSESGAAERIVPRGAQLGQRCVRGGAGENDVTSGTRALGGVGVQRLFAAQKVGSEAPQRLRAARKVRAWIARRQLGGGLAGDLGERGAR